MENLYTHFPRTDRKSVALGSYVYLQMEFIEWFYVRIICSFYKHETRPSRNLKRFSIFSLKFYILEKDTLDVWSNGEQVEVKVSEK